MRHNAVLCLADRRKEADRGAEEQAQAARSAAGRKGMQPAILQKRPQEGRAVLRRVPR